MQAPLRLRRGLVDRAQRSAADGDGRAADRARALRAGAARAALAQPRPPRGVARASRSAVVVTLAAGGRRAGARRPARGGPPRRAGPDRRRAPPRSSGSGAPTRTWARRCRASKRRPFRRRSRSTLAPGAPSGSGRDDRGRRRASWPGVESAESEEDFGRRFRDAVRLLRGARLFLGGVLTVGRDPLGRLGDPARARPAPRGDRDHAPDGRDRRRDPRAVLALRGRRGARRRRARPGPPLRDLPRSRRPGSRGSRIRSSPCSGSGFSTRRRRCSLPRDRACAPGSSASLLRSD